MIDHIKSKIQDWDTIERTVARWKFRADKIVFTNGCFDLLHYGHLHYLSEARMLGDRLIVGVNGADSVSRLKGQHRPINDDLTRLHLIAGLLAVDAVVVFEEDTPFDLIQLIRPDVLVKGGDWKIDEIIGSDIVIAAGGIVKSLSFVEGYSTTNIEQKIKRS